MTMFFAQADGTAVAASTTAQAAPATAQTTPAAADTTTAQTVQPAQQTAPQQQGSPWASFVPILFIFAIFYFMMIRPQQRKEKERRKMIEELRAGAKVMFAGGLMGTIVEAKERTFMIELADKVVIEVARAAVQTVIVDDPQK